MLDLVFYLGKNERTGGLQWKADEADGHRTVVYVPDKLSALQPSSTQRHFECAWSRTVFQNETKTFAIVAVDLIKAIEDKVAEVVEPVEPAVVDFSDIEHDFELEFARGVNPKHGHEQWESRVLDKDTGFTTLYVVDRESRLTPSMNGEMFAAVEKRVIFNDNALFAIILVTLVARLYLEDLYPQGSGLVGSIRPPRRGRSPSKRADDRQKRASMRGEGKGGNKKQKSA